MKRFPRLDSNHKEVASALRRMGCSVQSLASVGGGCPDLLVGWRGANWLFEIKDGEKVPSARRLTEDEADWHERWLGQVVTVESAQAAVNYMIAVTR